MAPTDPAADRQPWPRYANTARLEAYRAAGEARKLVQEMIDDPDAARVNGAFVLMYLSDIMRMMAEAGAGRRGE